MRGGRRQIGGLCQEHIFVVFSFASKGKRFKHLYRCGEREQKWKNKSLSNQIVHYHFGQTQHLHTRSTHGALALQKNFACNVSSIELQKE